jgi:hypothetical protein
VAESKIGKGANRALMQNSGTAQNRSGALNAKSNSIYGTLDPALTAEATNPTGYAPNDLAAMNTASQQSLGGSTAGITGQANLEAARTRNAGGFQGAIGSGSRSNAKQLSQNALGIQEQNAQLKEAHGGNLLWGEFFSHSRGTIPRTCAGVGTLAHSTKWRLRQ